MDLGSTRGLYYKPMMIVNDDSRVINMLEISLADDARVVKQKYFTTKPIGENC